MFPLSCREFSGLCGRLVRRQHRRLVFSLQIPICREVAKSEKSEFHKERIMVKEVKWTKYLWLSLLSFGGFMLEFLSIFGIEVIFLNVDIQNYTMQQRSIHCIIMVFMWAFFIGVLLLFFHFVSRGVGLEIWNGISTMIFSVLSGVMYLRLNRKCLYSYLFIAIGYLL